MGILIDRMCYQTVNPMLVTGTVVVVVVTTMVIIVNNSDNHLNVRQQ